MIPKCPRKISHSVRPNPEHAVAGYRIQSTWYQKVLEYFCGKTAWQRYRHLIPHTKKRVEKNITGSEGGAQQVCRAVDAATTPVEHVGVYHRRTNVFVPE
jgi:hypothetical protein